MLMLRAVWHGKTALRKAWTSGIATKKESSPYQNLAVLTTLNREPFFCKPVLLQLAKKRVTAFCMLHLEIAYFSTVWRDIHSHSRPIRFSLLCTSILFGFFILFSAQHSVANQHVTETYFAYAHEFTAKYWCWNLHISWRMHWIRYRTNTS